MRTKNNLASMGVRRGKCKSILPQELRDKDEKDISIMPQESRQSKQPNLGRAGS